MFARLTLAAAAAVAAVVVAGRPSAANEVHADLSKQLAPTAQQLVQLMLDEKLSRAKFGVFLPPASPESNYAAGARQIFLQEFAKAAKAMTPTGRSAPAAVDTDHDFEVRAEMNFVEVDAGKDKAPVLQILFFLRKPDGSFVTETAKQVVENLRERGNLIGNLSVVVAAAGGIVDLPAEGAEGGLKDARALVRAQTSRKNPAQPPFELEGRMIKTSKSSPYGVEVLVADEAAAPTTYDGWLAVPAADVKIVDNRRPVVDIKPGQVYAIKVTVHGKESLFDAAVEATVDGIDVFHFAHKDLWVDGRPPAMRYICPRAADNKSVGTLIIPGWHHTNKDSKAFLVKELGKGTPERVAAGPGTPGVITVNIAGAWDKGETPPMTIRGMSGSRWTDVGKKTDTGFNLVNKEIGAFKTFLSIHYQH
jgi:hypothetical protein